MAVQLSVKELDNLGCRFPMIAYWHLESAKAALPAVREDKVVWVAGREADMRHHKDWERVHSDAIVSTVCAAAAVEAEILSVGLFLHMDLLDRGTKPAPKRFALKFIKKKHQGRDQYRDMMNGKEYHVRGAWDLYEFAAQITRAFRVTGAWPAQPYPRLAEVRNRLVHNHIRPMKAGGRHPFGIGPQGSIQALVRQAEGCFEVMCECLKSLHCVHFSRDDFGGFEKAMSKLKIPLRPRSQWPSQAKDPS